MGCFDTIWTNCPTCGAPIEWAAYNKDCNQQRWNLKDAPSEVVATAIGKTELCDCGTGLTLVFWLGDSFTVRVSTDIAAKDWPARVRFEVDENYDWDGPGY